MGEKKIEVRVVEDRPPPRGAVMQLEITRRDRVNKLYYTRELIELAVKDTIENGGTFVLVVTADKITAVQRPDAEEQL